MTQAELFAARLEAAGLESCERWAKQRLLQRILDTWQRDVRTPISGAWWVPGRLEVFGSHTDYAGGRSLVAAVPRGMAFVAAPRTDGVIRVIDAADPGDETGGTISIDQPPTRFLGWRHYVEVTAARLARNFPGSSLAADIHFASDLPRAAGMSSSSALVVGIATALAHTGGLRERPEWQRSISTRLDEAGYLACIENGRTFGELQGDAGVGTHGGSEDHAAMVAGTAGACSAFSFVPLTHLSTVALPASWTVVVASSGIGSHKTGSEREAYNRLSSATAALLDLWNAHEPPRNSLGAALASSSTALSQLAGMVRRSSIDGWPAPDLLERLQHFAREDGRVAEAVTAIENAEGPTLGRLAAESQAESERLLKNQVPETSALVALARDAGAIGARSFGAGFGGSVWAVVDAADAVAFLGRWTSAYRSQWRAAAERSVAFVSNPGPPVTQVF